MTSSEATVPQAAGDLGLNRDAHAVHHMILQGTRVQLPGFVFCYTIAPCERLTNCAQSCLPSLDVMIPPPKRGILRPTGWHSSIVNPWSNLI